MMSDYRKSSSADNSENLIHYTSHIKEDISERINTLNVCSNRKTASSHYGVLNCTKVFICALKSEDGDPAKGRTSSANSDGPQWKEAQNDTPGSLAALKLLGMTHRAKGNLNGLTIV
jgi:hypothetical protein